MGSRDRAAHLLSEIFGIFTDTVQMRGLELVEPRQPKEIHARYACDSALVHGYLRRPCPVAKDRKINPI